ncbi:MAG TPA: cobalamin-dependent protein [Solirubrobacterales bacterium]|nr:cobalamin-dependent protein [Solirubrobacterales bacterium]
MSRSYLDALRAADVAGAYKVATRALEGGMSPAALYQRVIATAMHELGRLWKAGAITIADEHLATALTHRVLAALRSPQLLELTLDARMGRPCALLAAVEGEQHALGLRMAADLLEDAGYRTAYLGADVPTRALLQAVRTFSPDLVGLSATMPESTRRLEEAVEQMRGEHPRLPLLVGGQGSGSPRLGEGTVVQDLELLAAKAPLP